MTKERRSGRVAYLIGMLGTPCMNLFMTAILASGFAFFLILIAIRNIVVGQRSQAWKAALLAVLLIGASYLAASALSTSGNPLDWIIPVQPQICLQTGKC